MPVATTSKPAHFVIFETALGRCALLWRGRTNRTIKKVTEDLEHFRFNTAIAALMEHTNYLLAIKGEAGEERWNDALRTFVTVLAPFAPHHAEEMWAVMGEPYSVHEQA